MMPALLPVRVVETIIAMRRQAGLPRASVHKVAGSATRRAASVSVRPSKNVLRKSVDSFSGKAHTRSRRNMTSSRWSEGSLGSGSLDITFTLSRLVCVGRHAGGWSAAPAAGAVAAAGANAVTPPCAAGDAAAATLSVGFRSYWRPSNAARSNQAIFPSPSSIAPRMRYQAYVVNFRPRLASNAAIASSKPIWP